jgi:hypothetical protein
MNGGESMNILMVNNAIVLHNYMDQVNLTCTTLFREEREFHEGMIVTRP